MNKFDNFKKFKDESLTYISNWKTYKANTNTLTFIRIDY